MSAEAPQAVIAMPLFNGEQHVREALESLLCQSYANLRLVLVDDGSTDATADIVADYVARDERIHYEVNASRLGMTANWRRAYCRARELHPAAELFAWGSDHDVWHRRWLQELVSALQREPDAVLAYPLNLGISDERVVVREPWRFSTADVADRRARLINCSSSMVAGNMIYGVFRADVPGRLGVYRSVLLPDRLLLAEAATLGRFVQVEEILWFRRYSAGKDATRARQRRSFFPNGAPAWSYVPWPVQHAVPFALDLAVRGRGGPEFSRAAGTRLTVTYALRSARFELRRAVGRRRHHWRKAASGREKRVIGRLEGGRLRPTSPVARFGLRSAHRVASGASAMRTSEGPRLRSVVDAAAAYRPPNHLRSRRDLRRDAGTTKKRAAR